jgi:bifunctional non-homologous end joining protein LigD
VARDLSEYRRRRDFAKTPEPSGEKAAGEAHGQGRFVVQEHDATNLHWDLRLEHEGVALSWALPRGIPQRPEREANRLAVRTEDHPLRYIDFEGEIPRGEYGAGRMSIWDRGTYEAEKLSNREVIATFAGERLRGRYALFRTGGKNWIIHRMDPASDPDRIAIPKDLRPMLPSRGELPSGQGRWAFEIDWAGLRTLLWCEPGHILRSQSRGLEKETVTVFPELRRIARQLGSTEAVLDGEIVVLNSDGRPSAERLRERKRAGSEARARTASKHHPATLMIFDLLFCDGRMATGLAYEERRSLLEGLELDGPAWQTPSAHRGDGAPLLEAATGRGLSGLVAKRLGSEYRPGKRSADWVRIRS